MIRSRQDTEIEVWDITYINRPERRMEEDKNAFIVQIERADDVSYIVEFIRREHEWTPIPLINQEPVKHPCFAFQREGERTGCTVLTEEGFTDEVRSGNCGSNKCSFFKERCDGEQ